MSEEVEDVRVALRKRFGNNGKEIELMLSRYVGQHLTVRSFFRHWLETRLAEQAGWMMDYINVEVIADAAVAMGRVVTVPAKPASHSSVQFGTVMGDISKPWTGARVETRRSSAAGSPPHTLSCATREGVADARGHQSGRPANCRHRPRDCAPVAQLGRLAHAAATSGVWVL